MICERDLKTKFIEFLFEITNQVIKSKEEMTVKQFLLADSISMEYHHHMDFNKIMFTVYFKFIITIKLLIPEFMLRYLNRIHFHSFD